MQAAPPPPVQADYAQLFRHIRRELEPNVAQDARVLIYAADDVRRWLAARAEGERPDLTRSNGQPVEMIEAVRTELLALYNLLCDEPDPDTAEAVAYACTRIALWAEGWGACNTALAFAQLAQEVQPSNAYFAYDVGRLARALADYPAAVTWLKWACRLSCRQQAWRVYFLSLAGLGNVCRRTGNYPLAVRFHHLSLRVAHRRELRTLGGDALYDLAIMHFEMKDTPRGSTFARQALEAYGHGHARIPYLAHDIALFWMDETGDFKNARDIFQALLAHLWKPAERIVVFASLARAAAGLGDEHLFEMAWNETWKLLRVQEHRDGHAAALLQLAHGAASFGYWSRVEIAATEALGLARVRGEGKHILVSEKMIEVVREVVLPDERIVAVFPDYRRCEAPATSEGAEELAVELVNAMRARRDNAPESTAHTLIAGKP